MRTEGSAIQNSESSGRVLFSAVAAIAAGDQPVNVSDSDEPDWYLREWMIHCGKIQASLVNELGWEKSKANEVWHGSRPYRRAVVNEIAAWLGTRPYELLMPVEEALRLRQLREAAFAIAANNTQSEVVVQTAPRTMKQRQVQKRSA